MKRVLFLLILSFTFISIHSQERVSNDSILNTYSYSTIGSKSDMGKAGFYLSESAKFRIGALSCGAASAISFGSIALVKENDGYKKEALVTAGIVTGVAALVCEILSVKYKLKSGKCLMIQGSGDTASLVLTF